MPWIVFLASATVIVIAGTKLSRYGDQIAERTGLGGLWIGALLMAGATSLPELLTTASAALLDAPNLAVGDVLGACMTNMLTLGIADLLHRQKRLLEKAAFEHTLAAALAMVLTGLTGLFILARPNVAVWGVGIDTFGIAVIYVLGMRLIYRQEFARRRERQLERLGSKVEAESEPRAKEGLRRVGLRFAAASGTIVLAAPALAWSAQRIAEITGIGTTFIGTFLVALATTLPELVTSLAAVRLGAFDLAVGNLFGSNAFNVAVLFVTDIAYRKGPLLSSVSHVHAATAFLAILLMNAALMGIIYRAEKRYLLIEPDSLTIISGYVLGMLLLYSLGG